MQDAKSNINNRGLTTLNNNKQNETIRPSAFHRLSRENIEISETWIDQSRVDPNSAKLENIKYETLTQQELNKLNKSTVPNNIIYKIELSNCREQFYLYLIYNHVVYRIISYNKF